MSALTAALTVLAVARLTRLLTADRVLDRPRVWFMERTGPESMAAYFVTCPWCMSMYVGAAGAGAWAAWGTTTAYQAVTLALAASQATGWLATREDA